MPSIHYCANISMKKDDWIALKKLQKSGYRVVDILRSGIRWFQAQEKATKAMPPKNVVQDAPG